MKKFLLSTMVVLCCFGCSKNDVPNEEPTEVVLTFRPYEMEQITRAAVSDFATRLDVWVYQAGSEVQVVHQQSTDEGFGSVALTLDKTKTYTLYAVAHKGSDVAALTSGVVAFPEEKTTHSFFYTETFSPATKTNLACVMQRIVGQFRLEITDDMPAAFKGLRLEIPQAPTRYNVSSGACTPVDRVSTLSWTGSVSSFNFFILADDEDVTEYDITVTAHDADGETLQQRVFPGVGIKNNYRTTYRGAFFTDAPVAVSFTVADMQDFAVVNF